MSEQLEDLFDPLFDDMSDDEVMDFIKGVRRSRLTPKATSKKVKKAKKAKQKNADKAKTLFDSLSPEERAEIFKNMGGG